MRKPVIMAVILLLFATFSAAGEAGDYSGIQRVDMVLWPVFGAADAIVGTEYSLDVNTGIVTRQEVSQHEKRILERVSLHADPFDVQVLLALIQAHTFFDLPEEIEAPDVLDGAEVYVQVKTAEWEKTCGGLNANYSANKAFVEICEAFQQLYERAKQIGDPAAPEDMNAGANLTWPLR